MILFSSCDVFCYVDRRGLSKQTSCPSLIVTTHWPPASPKSNMLHNNTNNDDKKQYQQHPSTLSTSTCWSTTSDFYGRGGGKEEIPSMMGKHHHYHVLSYHAKSKLIQSLQINSHVVHFPLLSTHCRYHQLLLQPLQLLLLQTPNLN